MTTTPVIRTGKPGRPAIDRMKVAQLAYAELLSAFRDGSDEAEITRRDAEFEDAWGHLTVRQRFEFAEEVWK